MPAPLDPRIVTKFDQLLIREGCSTEEAAERAGVGVSWAYKRLRRLREDGKLESRLYVEAAKQGGPIPYNKLRPQARRAWDDLEYFRLRYFGHVTYGWQREATAVITAALRSDTREYVVINVAPGAGKTIFCHDVAAWMTVRNRAMRGMFGSRTQSKATKMLNMLRRDLERSRPAKAEEDAKRLGYAVDAEATLTEDFGLFKPLDRAEPWRQDAFVVVQNNFDLTAEKEHTWVAYGLDTDYLGDRIDIAIWDDAQILRDLSTTEKIETQRNNFDQIAETRLEPGGVLFLVGQRLGADDIYRHCLDKVALPDDDATLDVLDAMSEEERSTAYDGFDRKYKHVKFPAHFDEKCQQDHAITANAYPDGCLLSPHRTPWRELRALKHNDPHTYEVLYQQEDTASDDVLVKRVWVDGGTDPEYGTMHFGCKDELRGLNEIPQGLTGPLFHIATVDPSPTRFWAIQSWVAAPNAGNQLFLMETVKTKMTADRLLDWKQEQGCFTGLMEEWQTRSEQMGLPIRHWIVEQNGAQRFLLQYDHVRRWCQEHLTNIVPHTTAARKNDPEYGIYTLREWWRSGRVRLPMRGDTARLASLKLIDEVQKYPHGMQDDQVMAMWFLTSHLEQFTVQTADNVLLRRPGVASVFDSRRLVAVR